MIFVHCVCGFERKVYFHDFPSRTRCAHAPFHVLLSHQWHGYLLRWLLRCRCRCSSLSTKCHLHLFDKQFAFHCLFLALLVREYLPSGSIGRVFFACFSSPNLAHCIVRKTINPCAHAFRKKHKPSLKNIEEMKYNGQRIKKWRMFATKTDLMRIKNKENLEKQRLLGDGDFLLRICTWNNTMAIVTMHTERRRVESNSTAKIMHASVGKCLLEWINFERIKHVIILMR